eukprot:4934250-Alexandrium_andersonii.AAC.1
MCIRDRKLAQRPCGLLLHSGGGARGAGGPHGVQATKARGLLGPGTPCSGVRRGAPDWTPALRDHS